MRSQEHPEGIVYPTQRDELPPSIRVRKHTVGHGISPSTNLWPDLSGDIDRPRPDNAFSQEVSVDA